MEVFLSTHSYKLFGTTCIAGGIHKDNNKSSENQVPSLWALSFHSKRPNKKSQVTVPDSFH